MIFVDAYIVSPKFSCKPLAGEKDAFPQSAWHGSGRSWLAMLLAVWIRVWTEVLAVHSALKTPTITLLTSYSWDNKKPQNQIVPTDKWHVIKVRDSHYLMNHSHSCIHPYLLKTYVPAHTQHTG